MFQNNSSKLISIFIGDARVLVLLRALSKQHDDVARLCWELASKLAAGFVDGTTQDGPIVQEGPRDLDHSRNAGYLVVFLPNVVTLINSLAVFKW